MQQDAVPSTDRNERNSGVFWFLILRIPELFLAMLLGILVVFMSISVFSRYVLNIGMAWSDEAARLLFIWIVFVGFAVGVRHRGHIAIDWAVGRLPWNWRRAASIFQDLLILIFSMLFTWQSIVTVRFSFLQRLPGLRISIAWLYGASLIAGLFMTIYALANLWETIRGAGQEPDSLGEESLRRAE